MLLAESCSYSLNSNIFIEILRLLPPPLPMDDGMVQKDWTGLNNIMNPSINNFSGQMHEFVPKNNHNNHNFDRMVS